MRTRSNHDYENRLMAKAVNSFVNRARQFFSLETRALLRQNAIRKTIASLVETERMRLALAIAHRHDG